MGTHYTVNVIVTEVHEPEAKNIGLVTKHERRTEQVVNVTTREASEADAIGRAVDLLNTVHPEAVAVDPVRKAKPPRTRQDILEDDRDHGTY